MNKLKLKTLQTNCCCLVINKFYSIKTNIKNYGQVISDAEKVVGVPTSFLSLRCLMNDEVADIANHMRKLMGTGHPLINTAKDLIMEKDTMPKWGLIILLLSKCQQINIRLEIQPDLTEGILPQQRTLAEVTEMVRISNVLHNSIVNHEKSDTSNSYGNKLALLSGDFLLSTSFKLLAEMRNQEVNLLISTALRDLNESNFIEPRDKQNKPLPAKPLKKKTEIEVPVELTMQPYKISEYLGSAKSEWTIRSLLGGATLMARSCEATMILSENIPYQNSAHVFGRNMGLLFQISQELKNFQDCASVELTSAPILFHLEYEPSLYEEIVENSDKIEMDKLKNIVNNGPGIEKTIKLKKYFTNNALKALHTFPKSKARLALESIIENM
ncbi:unnamed protein product [Brassicogethes aeneus]|uniref:Decaprenyl-diphosphate synthase subunit 2 n=1 Tax=Brassicogethes aeneus TaxID=1431903 RepID=A0A9P0FHF1_BRAAE|nr:unnamed protein product [Brassicogethes aeneus]